MAVRPATRQSHPRLRESNRLANIKPERDGKLLEIKQAVRDKAENPTLDRDDNPNRKLLVFTTFKDTANYLYGQARRAGP